MSFGFTAVGSKAEVIAQCRAHNIDHGGDIATATRNLIVEALENDTAEPYQGGRFAYIVKASGHAGNGGTTYLSVSIEAQWVPEAVEVIEVVEAAASEDDSYDVGEAEAASPL
jgi:hypothetical protein